MPRRLSSSRTSSTSSPTRWQAGGRPSSDSRSPLRTTSPVPAAGAPGQPQLLNQRVVEALFAEDAVKNRRNTQAIEVAPNTLVAARVVDHRRA